MCREKFPDQDWCVDDVHVIRVGQTFDGVLAWDSFFHLTPVDQRKMLSLFQTLTLPGSSLMFTSGPFYGVAMGTYRGEPSTRSRPNGSAIGCNGGVSSGFPASAPTITSSTWRRTRTGIARIMRAGSASNPRSYRWGRRRRGWYAFLQEYAIARALTNRCRDL